MKKGKKDEDNPHFPTFFTFYPFYLLLFSPIIIYYLPFYFFTFLLFYLFTFLPFPISYLNPIFRLKLSGFSLYMVLSDELSSKK